MANNKNFASFMAQLSQNEGVDVLGLNSYLIKPLQRITKVSRHEPSFFNMVKY
jgi:hypothetical protein